MPQRRNNYKTPKPIKERRRGAPSTFTEHVADRLIDYLQKGMTLKAACRERNMPPSQTVQEWIKDNPEFAERYREARELGYLIMADELMDIADDGTNDWQVVNGKRVINQDHVARSRLRCDTRKWILARALPKIYGDKLEHSGEVQGTVTIVRLSDIVDSTAEDITGLDSPRLPAPSVASLGEGD